MNRYQCCENILYDENHQKETIHQAISSYVLKHPGVLPNSLPAIFEATGIQGYRELARLAGLSESLVREWQKKEFVPLRFLFVVWSARIGKSISFGYVRRDGGMVSTAADNIRQNKIRAKFDLMSEIERVDAIIELMYSHSRGILNDIGVIYPQYKNRDLKLERSLKTMA